MSTAPPPPAALPRLADRAGDYADLAMANVVREFPHATGHLTRGAGEPSRPRELHPAFAGAYDWHSCVHMHWLGVRLLTDHPDRVDADRVREVFDTTLTGPALAAEARYLLDNEGWERPYGWGWAVALAAACATAPDPAAARWATALTPVTDAVEQMTRRWLPRLGPPVRDGLHANTAFGLTLLFDGFRSLGRDAAAQQCAAAGLRLFAADRDAPAAWEPSGQDFLSPALTEALLLQRLLQPAEFAGWLGAFLPGIAERVPAALFEPVAVSDPGDPQMGHLLGLLLTRSWMCSEIAAALPVGDARVPVLTGAAAASLAAGLPHVVSGDFVTDHYLATFATLALRAAERTT